MPSYNFQPLISRAKEIVEWLGKELAAIRTGRPNPSLLDGVTVESYGSRVPLRQVAAITIGDARSLKVTLWDKGQVKSVEAALASANLGVSLQSEGLSIRVIFPELTTDKRKLLIKLANEKTEEAKISLRQERDRYWGLIQDKTRAGEIPEDDKFRHKDELQKIIVGVAGQLAAALARKEKEINS